MFKKFYILGYLGKMCIYLNLNTLQILFIYIFFNLLHRVNFYDHTDRSGVWPTTSTTLDHHINLDKPFLGE